MDNHTFKIVSDSNLEGWINCAAGRQNAVGYSVEPAGKRETYLGKEVNVPHRIIFYWTVPRNENYHPFPTKLDAEGICFVAKNWLKNDAEYGPQPDHDGSNKEGFVIYNEEWGHVDGQYEAFLAVAPNWSMYGK